MYTQEPTLPIDVKPNLVNIKENEVNDCFEDQIVKFQNFNFLGVVDQLGKMIIILDHMLHKRLQ